MSRITRDLTVILLLSGLAASGGEGEKKAKPKTVLKMYDIRELIMVWPDFPGPEVGMAPYAGRPVFSSGRQAGAMLDAASLVEGIKRRIQPDSWGAQQGTAIDERSGWLVVINTPEVHRQVAALLRSERREIKSQLHVRALVLALDDKGAAALRRRRSRVFSREEVEALRKAAGPQGLLASPGVLCLNDQRNHVGAVTRVPHVVNLQASGACAGPVEGSLWLGTVLDVRPLLTFDRDAADVTVRLSFAGGLRMTRKKVSGRFTPPPPRDKEGNPVIGPGVPEPRPYRGTLDLPGLALWRLRTNATVPLGRYVLAGAFTLPEGAGAPRTAAVLLGAERVAPPREETDGFKEKPDERGQVQRIFDVRELTNSIASFPGPGLGRPQGWAGGVPVAITMPPPNQPLPPGALQDVIKRIIEPASWGFGGTSIEETHGRLIVYHTPAVQARIARYISGLRPKVRKQIQIQALLVAAGERTGAESECPTVLSAEEAEKLLGDGRRIVAGGRIACYNAQRACVFSGRQASRLVPGVGLPSVESPRSGFVFDVRPLLSAGGGSATLELRVTQADCPRKEHRQDILAFRATPPVPLGRYVLVGSVRRAGGGEGLLLLVRAEAAD